MQSSGQLTLGSPLNTEVRGKIPKPVYTGTADQIMGRRKIARFFLKWPLQGDSEFGDDISQSRKSLFNEVLCLITDHKQISVQHHNQLLPFHVNNSSYAKPCVPY
jgi:hypothetical protein